MPPHRLPAAAGTVSANTRTTELPAARNDSGGEGQALTDQDNTAPAVWDPTARGGAGGWVRRKPSPAEQPPAQPQPPVQQPAPQPPFRPVAPSFPAGAAGDEGPLLGARPYLPPAPPPAPAGYGYPQAPPTTPPATSPGPPPGPPAAAPGGFPSHSTGFPPGAAQGQPPYPGFPAPGGGAQPGFPGAEQQGQYGLQNQFSQFGQYEDVPPYDDEPARSRKPLYVALGVVLAVILGVGTVWAVENTGGSTGQAKPVPAGTGPQAAPSQTAPAQPGTAAAPSPSATSPSTPAAGANAAAQAKALDDLLSRGENAKAPIGSAVAKVKSCPAKAEVDGAAQIFQDAASQRDQLITDLARLNLGDLQGGADAAQSLRTAWQQSGDIDRAYAAWAHTVSSQGCAGGAAPNTADLKRANDLNPQATQSKKDFVDKWNSLAGTFNLTARTWDRI